MSTTEPDHPPPSGPPRAERVSATARGVIVEMRGTMLVVTVMPTGAPAYRARISVFPHQLVGLRVGSHVELIIGDDPSEIRLAPGAPPAA